MAILLQLTVLSMSAIVVLSKILVAFLCCLYAISQLRIVRLGLHLVTYLNVGNFCDRRTGATLPEICVQVFLIFFDSSKPSQSVSLIYWLLEPVNLRKTCSKLHVRLLPWPKLPTYSDDVTTIESNRQVRVNIDATLVAIFRIGCWIFCWYRCFCHGTESDFLLFLLQTCSVIITE